MPRGYQILTEEKIARDAERRRSQLRIALTVLGVLALAVVAYGAYLIFRPEPPPATDYTNTIDISGQDRPYHVHLPPGYNERREWPVVLMFHGLTQTVEGARVMSQFDALADEENFIVVYPEGFLRAWQTDDIDYLGVDDLAYLNAVLDEIEVDLSVDTRRIYSTGFSQGAHMQHRLACEMPDRIAAFGPVAGIMSAIQPGTCDPGRPIPMILINSVDDQRVPYERRFNEMLGVPETIDFWVGHDNCNPEPVVEDLPDADPADGTTVSRHTYSGCDAGVEVVLYRIEGAGHTWAGGTPFDPRAFGLTSTDINASRTLWEFFEGIRLPQ